MKRGIAIFFAVLLSAFVTLSSQGAALVLVLAGFAVCLRIYFCSRSLPESEAIALKSSTANRVGQVLVADPLMIVIAALAGMSGVLAK